MLATGQIVDVEVRSVAVFGLFCRGEEQEVLVLIPETSWVASFCSCQQFAAPERGAFPPRRRLRL